MINKLHNLLSLINYELEIDEMTKIIIKLIEIILKIRIKNNIQT